MVENPIILSDDDGEYSNLNSTRYRENGNKLKHDPGENTHIVKHFVASSDRYSYKQ